MDDYSFETCKRIVSGIGVSHRLPDYCAELGMRRVMLVTDAGLLASGAIDPILTALRASSLALTIYSDVQADPPEAVVHEAAGLARQQGIDGVVGLGGGSSMDVAKLVAVLKDSSQPLADMYGVDKVSVERLPLVQVPTTAGTGSELTPIAVITTGLTTKMGVVSSRLLPDLALLDAALTVGLPPAITAATGIDAMVHAIEAYTSRTRKNPYSDMLARRALELMSGNLIEAVHNGTNMAAREAMLSGAMLAGQAFANAPVGGVHALAYPLGGHYHIPHGLSNSLVLPAVLRFNADIAYPHYAELADCIAVPASGSARVRCEAFICQLEKLVHETGLPATLSSCQVPQGDIPMLARDAMAQQRLLLNNPRELGESDAIAIYSEVY